jgi:hypothetical protein
MKTWQYYTTDEVKPRGWLKIQLEIQAEGLSGNLDKFWRDVRDSKWIGGTADGWERVPYWLDGFIPLAYLLENEDMITRAKKYVDAIISAQQEDGWICPCEKEERKTYDTWAVQLISKTLTIYYECSKDERAVTAIYKLLKNGATLVTESCDILNALGWEVQHCSCGEQLTLPMLTSEEEKIFTNLEIEEKGVDELLSLTGMSIDDLLINLTTMELKGIIKQCGGDRYAKV